MPKQNHKLRAVNLEYALVQGFYWIGFCGIISYASVYLQARGFSNTQLGQILAVGYILGFLLPQLLAGWIDRSEKLSVYHCQWALLASQVILVLVLRKLPGSGAAVSVLSALLIGTEVTLNPMNTEISADLNLRLGHINYGAARGTGSIAFAPFSVMIGALLESFGTGLLDEVFLICIFFQALALLLLCFSIRGASAGPEAARARERASGNLARFYRENRRFFGLLAGIALLFFAHNLVNNYLINVVRAVNGDTSDMGLLSGFTAFVEIPMMFAYDRLLRRFSCESTVRFAASVYVLKSLAIALSPNMGCLFAANCLQLLSFAMITPAMVEYVNRNIDHKDSAKGQALAFGMVTVGNILSSSVGGRLYDAFPVRSVLLIGACCALVGAVFCHVFSVRNTDTSRAAAHRLSGKPC
ncbi:MAG: MFS transporter [Oscillospiraceae bacterium]|nr:MFS transporter [Oscillospiraceae bacterium]